MNRITINSITHPLFEAFWELYEPAFPLCERRTKESYARVFTNPDFHLEMWVECGRIHGLIGWWECPGVRFAEHYAIHPDLHSSGYGSRFLKEWMAESATPVLLEIEPPVDEITNRRLNFYKRLGFHENNIYHLQPPYHAGMGPLHLEILSYPQVISGATYQAFVHKQRTEIMDL